MNTKANFNLTCSPLCLNPVSISKQDDSCSDSLCSIKPVSFEGKPNLIKNLLTHNSKLVIDKGRIKPEDYKEFDKVEQKVKNKHMPEERYKMIEPHGHSCTAELNNQAGQTESIYKESEPQDEHMQHKFEFRRLKMIYSAMSLKQVPHILNLIKN